MQRTRQFFQGLTLAAFALIAGVTGAIGSCIDAKQSETFSFEGVLNYKIFAGPPNFEDVRKGDTPEPSYILQLQTPICVSGDDFVSSDRQIDRIQIFPEYSDKKDHTLGESLRSLIGKHVVVVGKSPFGAHTGHHHAPLLSPISRITVAVEDPTSAYGTALTSVEGFYRALEVGDGNEAAKFVIPKKRMAGPLSANTISLFYRDMAEPLKLVDVVQVGPSKYRVRYTYAKTAARRCVGASFVRTTQIDGFNLIASIRALRGC